MFPSPINSLRCSKTHFYHSLVAHKQKKRKKCNNFSIFHELSFAYPDMFQNALVIFAYFASLRLKEKNLSHRKIKIFHSINHIKHHRKIFSAAFQDEISSLERKKVLNVGE
jgi:hypothetical protein